MNKTKAAVLSATTIANLTVAGLLAPSANAATHAATGAGVAAAAHVKPHGFVPKTASGAIPFTETGCSGNLCWGLHGGANHVSYVDEHFFSRTGCHVAHFWRYSPGGRLEASSTPLSPNGNFKYYCSHQDAVWSQVAGSWPTGTVFCGAMNTIPGGNTSRQGVWCEEVR